MKNAAQELKIPKTTFNKFFSDEQLLPDQIAKLLGKVEDPKQIIMDRYRYYYSTSFIL